MFGKVLGDEAAELCVSVTRTSTDFGPVNFITVNVFPGVNQQLLSLNEISQRDSYMWSLGNRRGRAQPRSRPHVPLAASSLTESLCLGWTLGRPRFCASKNLYATFCLPRGLIKVE